MRRALLVALALNELRAGVMWRSETAWLAPHLAPLRLWLQTAPPWALALFIVAALAVFGFVAALMARELIRAARWLARRLFTLAWS